MRESPADLILQKLRTRLQTKAGQASPGSPEHYRIQEMLAMPDAALLDTIFTTLEPNPDRVGCPPREVLHELATRTRPLSDPVWDHVMECSQCRIDVREMGRDRPPQPTPSIFRPIPIAAAAVLIIAIGIVAWKLTRGAAAPLTITGDLRQYAAMRSEHPLQSAPALDLPQQILQLTVVLPTGSEPGRYDLELRVPPGTPRATATGDATLENFITRLASTLDVRSAPRGPGELAIRRQGEEWQLFPVRIH